MAANQTICIFVRILSALLKLEEKISLNLISIERFSQEVDVTFLKTFNFLTNYVTASDRPIFIWLRLTYSCVCLIPFIFNPVPKNIFYMVFCMAKVGRVSVLPFLFLKHMTQDSTEFLDSNRIFFTAFCNYLLWLAG